MKHDDPAEARRYGVRARYNPDSLCTISCRDELPPGGRVNFDPMGLLYELVLKSRHRGKAPSATDRLRVVSCELNQLDLEALRDSQARKVCASFPGVMRTWIGFARLQHR